MHPSIFRRRRRAGLIGINSADAERSELRIGAFRS
jgi:hypothetical protein